MIYLFSLWLALGAAIVAMALYRKHVSRNEDDMLHLSPGTEHMVQQQASMASQLSWIDRWGKTLTGIEVLFGLLLAGVWLYQSWVDATRLH
jgi:hypothetical protein